MDTEKIVKEFLKLHYEPEHTETVCWCEPKFENKDGTLHIIHNEQRNILSEFLRTHATALIEVGRAENEELYKETNIKKLVEEMEEQAEEYGQFHDEDCQVNYEGGADFGYVCECGKIRAIKTHAREYMAKVNHMWVTNLQNHRKHCKPDGNKDLTKTKNRLSALTPNHE